MNHWLQNSLVLGAVAVAAGYVLLRLVKTLSSKRRGGHASCSGCGFRDKGRGSSNGPVIKPLVPLDAIQGPKDEP